jgi:hypothetical protein
MTTTGTSTFNLDFNFIAEEAFERCGVELRTGYDLRTARRSLNLLTMEWANRGINLWTIDEGTIPLVQGVAQYGMPVDTVDIIEHVVRTQTGQGQTDINITRISVDTYATIPNKNAQGRPIQLWFNRLGGQTTPEGVQYPTINVWPVPDQNNFYSLVVWRLRRIQDTGTGTSTQDIPFRFLPCMVAGLAYHLSKKIPGALERTAMLKAEYEELWQQAADEDREKAALRIAPRQMFY